MQINIDLSKKIAIEFDLERAFNTLLSMLDIIQSTNDSGFREGTIYYYSFLIEDITKAIQKQIIG